MDNNRDVDDLELNHLLGPFKRLSPSAKQKTKWRVTLANLANQMNLSGSRRFLLNPWPLAFLFNLILAFVVILSLPLANSRLVGHAISIQMKPLAEFKSYDVLAGLPVIKNAKLFWPEAGASSTLREFTLVESDTTLNIKTLEDQVMGIQDVEKLCITPIIKKEKNRLYQNIFNLFLLNEKDKRECYDYFLNDKRVTIKEKALLPVSHIVTLAKPKIVTSNALVIHPSPPRAKPEPSLIRKVKVDK